MPSWKKIIVSGSKAELNQITASNDIKLVGSITGSVSSTGSFGRVEATTLSGDGAGITGLTSAAIDTTAGMTDNYVLTATGASAVTGEANLQFDGTDVVVAGGGKVAFRDNGGEYIYSVADNVLGLAAGSEIDLTAITVDLNGNLDVSGNITSIGNITTQGDVIAQNYIVSSSVTYMTSSFLSGSTIFGDSIDDTHQFTGSMFISGGIFPSNDDAFDLGSATKAWQDLFLEGDLTLTDAGTIQTSAGVLTIDGAGGLTLDSDGTDAVNLGTEAVAKTITIGNAASTKVDINALALDFDSAAATDILAASTVSVKGATGASFGDDTGTWEFNGSGAVSETGMTTFDLTPSSTVDIDAGGAVTIDGTSITIGADDSGVAISIGHTTSETTINDNLTIVGNLVVQGDTIQQQVANLSVEDRFILLNSGSASGDGGIVVQTESGNGDGVAFGYDDNVSRWAFQQGTKLNATASAIAPDAYASAVVTSDDANYQKNGNIRVESGEIYIYVE